MVEHGNEVEDAQTKLFRELEFLIPTENKGKAHQIIDQIQHEQRIVSWTQQETRDDLHLNGIEKERTYIANVHINLLQGLIRTKFLADAAVKYKELKETMNTATSSVEDISQTKDNARKWVLHQIIVRNFFSSR